MRAQIYGDGVPRYAGFTAWRGVAGLGRDLVPPGAGLNLLGRGAEFGLSNIGHGRFYWYLTKNAPEGAPESLSGRKSGVLGLLAGWYPLAPASVEATEENAILRTDGYDREPLGERWGVGRVTLLGDAAHPMTPNLGQGACQAVEDAVVLARCLRERTVEDALRLYEARRGARTASIVRRSRLVGPGSTRQRAPRFAPCGVQERTRARATEAIGPRTRLRGVRPPCRGAVL